MVKKTPMKKKRIKFNILFRGPEYPVIVISSEDELSSAYNIDQLATQCIFSEPPANETYVKIIDSTGEEFWYEPKLFVLSPGFLRKIWTKKQIIELFNNSLNAKEDNLSYPLKSISNKKLSRIITDICEILYYE